MIDFEFTWAFLFLLLPSLMRKYGKTHYGEMEAVRAPFFGRLVRLSGKSGEDADRVARRNSLQRIMITTLWFLFVLARAKPVWVGEPVEIYQETREFLVAVDISGSMDTEDVSTGTTKTSRLNAIQQFLQDLVAERTGDRLGLMVFGSAPYLQLPFSTDQRLFTSMLNELQAHMAGPKTMLGDAIGLAIRHFDNVSNASLNIGNLQKDRVLLLITDGNDSGSKVPVAVAAQLAADRKITIHTVVVGDYQTGGSSAVDTDSLKRISKITGGRFFTAEDGSSLDQMLKNFREIVPDRQNIVYFRPKSQLFYWPLGLGVVLVLTVHYWLLLGVLRNRAISFKKAST
jgi:Ca-activated chloride channel family protein